MKTIVAIALFSLALLTQARPFETCGNATLSERGFEIHAPTKFDAIKEIIENRLDRSTIEFDSDGHIYSYATKEVYKGTSWDDTITERDLMYGDIFILEDVTTSEWIEIRWFDGQTKHVVYNRNRTPCATYLIPLAENALY